MEKEQLARLLAECARISDRLHELQRSGGLQHGNLLVLEAAFEELTAIRAALIRLMGRKP